MKIGNCREQIALIRYELKYFISYVDYMKIRNILSKFLKPDAHTKSAAGYWIRSLYFDTPDDHEYIEKVMGLETRKKMRLRIYDTQTERVKLEIKNKYNDYMKKETTIVTREEAERLISGDKSFLLKSNNSILNRVFYFMSEKYYMPVVIVDYYRDAFMADFNNIRITFDKQIEACVTDKGIFKKDLHLFPVFDSSTIVMEVKYNLFLPTWLKTVLSCIHARNSAISKYCYSRDVCIKNI